MKSDKKRKKNKEIQKSKDKKIRGLPGHALTVPLRLLYGNSPCETKNNTFKQICSKEPREVSFMFFF